MKVHLIRTPDYPAAALEEVLGLLRSLKMSGWNFVAQAAPKQDELANVRLNELRVEAEGANVSYLDIPSPWGELFEFCEEYRRLASVATEDYVAVLTSRPNEFN